MKILIVAFILCIVSSDLLFAQLPQSYPYKSYYHDNILYVAGDENDDMSVFVVNADQVNNVTYGLSGLDKANDVIAENTGEIYAAGYIYNTTFGNYDAAIVKFDLGEVTPLFVTTWDYSGSTDKILSITKDNDGNLYVCGFVTSDSYDSDFYTAMYSASGQLGWVNVRNLPGDQVATDILTDGEFVYVIGYTSSSDNMDPYGKNIMLQTIKINNSESNDIMVDLPYTNEIPYSFIISENANNSDIPITSKIIAAGITETPSINGVESDYFIVKFTRDITGTTNIVDWQTTYGSQNSIDVCTAICADESGNPVVTGYINNDGNFDFCTLKLDKDGGDTVWQNPVYYDYLSGNDKPSSIVRKSSDYYVSGFSEYSAGLHYVITNFTDENGTISDDWNAYYAPTYFEDKNAGYYDGLNTELFITENDDVITFAQAWNSSEKVFCVAAYSSKGSSIFSAEHEYSSNLKSSKQVFNKGFRLQQNYPNPFNPATKIDFYLPENSFVTLKVYDIIGREVSTLVNEFRTAGDHSEIFNAAGLPSGIYLYKITAAGNNTKFEKTYKMLLIK